MSAKGSCNCGGVKFEVATAPKDVYVCHCSICRKATGSGGIAVILTSKQEMLWLEGETLIETWKKPDHDWLSSFCKRCGSPLPANNDNDSFFVPVSLFDSGFEGLTVKHHLFVGSKANWEVIGDQGVQHLDNFDADNT